TGTLTLNRMTVTHLVTPAREVALSEGGSEAAAAQIDIKPQKTEEQALPTRLSPDVAWLVAGAALANDGRLEEEEGTVRAVGDPTETALLEAARRLDVDLGALTAAFPRVAELPFDSNRKRMTTFHR